MKKLFRFLLITAVSFALLASFLPTNVVLATIPGDLMEYYTMSQGGTSQVINYAQRIAGITFTASDTYQPTGVLLPLKRTGTPGINYIVGIKATSGGYPTGGYLMSVAVNGNSLSTSPAQVEYLFTTTTTINEGTTYALTLETYSDGNASNYISWMGDDVAHDDPDSNTVYDTSPSSLWTNNLGSTAAPLGFQIYGISGSPPLAVTFPMLRVNAAVLEGYGASPSGDLTGYGFDWGTESETYTEEVTAEVSGLSSCYFQATIDSYLDVGETYYFRAKAENANGWGYGEEKSFTYNPVNVNIRTTDAYVLQSQVSSNFTAAFAVIVEPDGISDNVDARMSTSSNWSDSIDLELKMASSGMWTFQTEDEYGNSYILSDNTTYYYQGWAVTSDNITHYSQTKSFTTAAGTVYDRPSVRITKLVDVSDIYSKDYVFEITAQITTSDTTADVLYYGIRFSDQTLDAMLLNPMQVLGLNVSSDGVYSLTLSFNDTTWYEGQRLYFQAVIGTAPFGDLLSPIVSYMPSGSVEGGGEAGGVVGGGDTPEIVQNVQGIVAKTKASLGLSGTMGTWAFMGLILLAIALVFGVATFSVPSNLRTPVAIIWVMISLSVVGAFVFSGQLGTWPIIIMVGATVMLIMTVVGLRLSGGTSNG